MKSIASTIDHTALKPDLTQEQIIQLCKEAKEHQFASVCVPPNMIALAKKELGATNVALCTVIGFPLGYSTSEVKAFEAQNAIALGAQELDMVVAIDYIKSEQWNEVIRDINMVLAVCRQHHVLLKVIVETALLSQGEKMKIYEICANLGVDFVKTSTGFSKAGATTEDIELMRSSLPENIKIKASGGIRDAKFAKELIKAGADRIGASSGIKIINEE